MHSLMIKCPITEDSKSSLSHAAQCGLSYDGQSQMSLGLLKSFILFIITNLPHRASQTSVITLYPKSLDWDKEKLKNGRNNKPMLYSDSSGNQEHRMKNKAQIYVKNMDPGEHEPPQRRGKRLDLEDKGLDLVLGVIPSVQPVSWSFLHPATTLFVVVGTLLS